jgi:hypothetical protein
MQTDDGGIFQEIGDSPACLDAKKNVAMSNIAATLGLSFPHPTNLPPILTTTVTELITALTTVTATYIPPYITSSVPAGVPVETSQLVSASQPGIPIPASTQSGISIIDTTNSLSSLTFVEPSSSASLSTTLEHTPLVITTNPPGSLQSNSNPIHISPNPLKVLFIISAVIAGCTVAFTLWRVVLIWYGSRHKSFRL